MVKFGRIVLSLWIFLDIVVFTLILKVIQVHVSRSGTEILESFCGESDGMCGGLSGTLDMDVGCGSSAQQSQGPQRQSFFRSAAIMQKASGHQALSCACIDAMRF